MKTLLAVVPLLLILLAISPPTQAEKQTLNAALAAWKMPRAKTRDLVQAGMRVFVSEAGFASTADEAMIHNVFINRSSSKRRQPTNQRLMYVMVAISNRTFPEGSPFLPPTYGARTRRQSWVSGINIDCTEPEAWNTVNDIAWRATRTDKTTGEKLPSYEKLCVALRKRTWQRMKEGSPQWCRARVDHWGGAMDMEYPMAGGWKQINCDDPAVTTCDEARKAHPKSPSKWPIGCTRNLGWCDPDLNGRYGNSCEPKGAELALTDI